MDFLVLATFDGFSDVLLFSFSICTTGRFTDDEASKKPLAMGWGTSKSSCIQTVLTSQWIRSAE
jgi:hypothetical protein